MKHDTVLYLGAHIDDVLLGAFSELNKPAQDAYLVSTTDNMPSEEMYPMAYTFVPKAQYRAALSDETARLSKELGIREYIEFPVRDGQSLTHAGQIAKLLETIVHRIRPTRIVFPAYEGGHIDHEVLSVIVGEQFSYTAAVRVEYALYHKENGVHVHNIFPGESHATIQLSEEELLKKHHALSILHTKKNDIEYFLKETGESVRPLGPTDYTKRPTESILYEQSSGVRFETFLSELQRQHILP